MAGLTGDELLNVKSALSGSGEDYVNDPTMEMTWAIKAYEHAEVYFKLLLAVDPTGLKLTRADDEIYNKFIADFPDLDVAVIKEDELKSPEGKIKWREFCNSFEGAVADWNMATLVRLDSSLDVSEKNTCIVPRIQFLAIEIARNRKGLNSGLKKKYGQKKEVPRSTNTRKGGCCGSCSSGSGKRK